MSILPLHDNPAEKKRFQRILLKDLSQLRVLQEEKAFDTTPYRMGAEMEFDIIDEQGNPMTIGPDIQKNHDFPFLTTEYARFNLEINATPHVIQDGAFEALHKELSTNLDKIRKILKKHNARTILTGILPTITESDVQLDCLTPNDRYQSMLHLTNELRGRKYEFHIEGLDKLISRENPSVYGGTFTSLQIHYQVALDEAIAKMNWAQCIAAPQLAVATNSPIFLNKRLWHETRIALFQQTTDIRRPYNDPLDRQPRVTFGRDWYKGDPYQYYRDEIYEYQALISDSNIKDIEQYEKYPELEALALFNSTIYRWNRLCYGSTGDSAHLRIENRLVPSGPSMQDQIANTALWVGLMAGFEVDREPEILAQDFDVHRQNFQKVARYGYEVMLHWLDGKSYTVGELYDRKLFRIAEKGLSKHGVGSAESDKYLNLIEKRLETGQTGSFWTLNSFMNLRKHFSDTKSSQMLVEAMHEYQQDDTPIHEWKDLKGKAHRGVDLQYKELDELTVVFQTDAIEFIREKADWRTAEKLIVMDDVFNLCGYVNLKKNKLKDSAIEFQSEKFGEPIQLEELSKNAPKVPSPVYEEQVLLGIYFPK